ncbi:MAG: prolipoprotein diacylglyceryl transferase [Candidatus Omnitrophica bacterium]|nr:prolipoprotein diacylglyceryl transferase [Candidatus Omnitrophota bacterium]
MFPILFKLGPITIYTYGVFVFLGVIAFYFICKKQACKEGISRETFSHIFFWSLIWGFLGARIVYILVEWRWFLSSPLGVIFSRSGFVFYGGVSSGILALYILAKKYKINFLKSADIAALAIPLGHAFGRVGCFFYGCCYGRAVESKWSVLFPSESPAGFGGVKVIPIQLYSAFFLVLIFLFLLILKKYQKFNGQILLSYGICYGIFRFIIEFYRGDPRGGFLSFSTSQFMALIVVIISIFFFFRWRPIRQAQGRPEQEKRVEGRRRGA